MRCWTKYNRTPRCCHPTCGVAQVPHLSVLLSVITVIGRNELDNYFEKKISSFSLTHLTIFDIVRRLKLILSTVEMGVNTLEFKSLKRAYRNFDCKLELDINIQQK
jgi:hypothetical protein